jgi:6-pyruvoyltetrahydropterin/6-carboxytetrahydropterin synthase
MCVFQDLNPTAENIVVIWNKIRKRIKPEFELEVFYETSNFVTYRGE